MNVNSKNQKLVLGVVCAALFPNVVQVVKPDIKYKASIAGESFFAFFGWRNFDFSKRKGTYIYL